MLESATSIHHFDATYLTPTDGLWAVLGPGSSGLQRRISLIKLDKSREEPKSREAGERKEPMLKSRSLLRFVRQFGFLGDAYLWE